MLSNHTGPLPRPKCAAEITTIKQYLEKILEKVDHKWIFLVNHEHGYKLVAQSKQLSLFNWNTEKPQVSQNQSKSFYHKYVCILILRAVFIFFFFIKFGHAAPSVQIANYYMCGIPGLTVICIISNQGLRLVLPLTPVPLLKPSCLQTTVASVSSQ